MSYIAKKHPGAFKEYSGGTLKAGCIYRKSDTLGPFPCLNVDFEIAESIINPGDTIVVVEELQHIRSERDVYKILHNNAMLYVVKDHIARCDFELIVGVSDGI